MNKEICGCNISDELSESKLNNYLTSLISTRAIDINHTQVRIGIFDSDTNIRPHENKEKKVFSFRIEPDGISTEFLFNDNEIKTDFDEKRLYVGVEFDKITKKHTCDPSLNLGGDNSNINKAGEKTIVESGVYNSENENIALPKEKFAQAVFNGEVNICEESWERFRHIFEKIQSFIDPRN